MTTAGLCCCNAAARREKSAGCGFAGDRQIGNVIIEALFGQFFCQERRPGLLGANAVAGRERVAHDQNGLGRQGWRGREQQGEQEKDEPHGR